MRRAADKGEFMSDFGRSALPRNAQKSKSAKVSAARAEKNTSPAAPRASGKAGTDAKKARATRDPRRTSAAILDAAIKEFTEKGFGGARINRIAARAKINKRMLYHYFGGKDALYLAVLEGAYISIRSAETGLHLADYDPIEGMREHILITWQYILDHPEFPSLLATENLHKAKYLQRSARIFGLHSPLVAEISKLLQRGEAAGQFRSGTDPVKVYISIASLGFFYLSNRWTLSTIFRRDLAEDTELHDWGEHMVDVILSYLRP
jgi:AcrR family transcriptional regulator